MSGPDRRHDRAAATRPRAVVLGAGDRSRIAGEAAALRPLIERLVDVVVWDLKFEAALAEVAADMVIVLGGDGSILRAAHQLGYSQRPVLGVNLGNLGFLADVSPADLESALDDVVAGRFEIVEHLMFECRVFRGDEEVFRQLGLNETTVLSGEPFSMLDVDLYIDAELVTTYSCDGLIISAPVGSTAHSLSAGGPILRKDLQAFVISPISPHTLTNRPVVDGADRVYEMVVPRPNPGTSLIVDGHTVCRVGPQDRIRVERAEPRFKMIEIAEHSYYRTLREKLRWSGRLPSE